MTVEKDFFTLYEQWHQSPTGAFALQCAQRLTEKMLSPWPRRGHTILQIYFSHSSVLEFLWHSGLDVSAVTPCAQLLESMEPSLRQKIDVHTLAPAALDHMPFGDKSFDYVALSLPPIPSKQHYPPLHALLQEAIRMAAKGVLFQGWNPCSMVGMQHAWRKKSLPPFLQASPWYAWRDVTNTLRTLSAPRLPASLGNPLGRIHTRSTLFTPLFCWKTGSFSQKCTGLPLPGPLGALMQVRLHLSAQIPMTSTPLHLPSLANSTMQPAPVAERVQNFQSPCPKKLHKKT